MMLTREETAKVISLYLYANVHYRDYTYCVSDEDYEKENNHELNYLRVLTPSTLTTSYSGSIVSRDVSKIKLLLTPLSAITDEHLIEFLKMIDFSDEEISEFDISEANKKAFSESDTMANIPYYIADQLRSWGYMLPYNGVDLFEAGIAIIKQ